MKTKLLLALNFVVLIVGTSTADDRTIKEFKQYAAERVSALSESQLDAFAAAVDKDGDGKISDAEFAQRRSALEKLAANQTPPAKKASKEMKAAKEEQPEPVHEVVVIPARVETDTYPILLITADSIAKSWQPYADWKTQSGRATKIITVGQIAEEYEADIIQEKIRLCVRDHIDNHGARWVVLGGDCLPGGKGLVPGGHTTVHAQERKGIPTDIVYLSETNWDADDDGIYGEWEDDRDAISYPDGSVGLGRIPVRTVEDVAAFTEKVIAYESRYPKTEFAQRMVYTCTDRPAYPKVLNSWDGFVSESWKNAEVDRFFSQKTPWDDDDEPGSYELSANNLVKLVNDKTTGKLHIHGHGHLPSWGLEDSMFSAKHAAKLSNDGAYPLITTVSCNTGEYDSAKDPSIVESIIRQPKGGSVAVVAPVRTGKPHFHKRSDMRLMIKDGKLDGTTQTMTRYWCHGLGEDVTTGHAMMMAKADMSKDARKSPGYHLCICELNLLGDPTLDMRAAAPKTPEIKVAGAIPVGKSKLEITTGAPNCTVCVWKDKEVYSVTQADEKGRASVQIAPSSLGPLTITASGPSLNTVSVSAKVTHLE